MNWQAIRGHLLVLAATVSGIAGMGMVFNGAAHGSLVGISRGVPFLLIGLWWAGRELGRSMMATGSRRGQASDLRRGQASDLRRGQASDLRRGQTRRNRRSLERMRQAQEHTVNGSGQ